jgi:flavin reductase (DIM6/NTAB) family NADH-FMN oxidoreductase RutF
MNESPLTFVTDARGAAGFELPTAGQPIFDKRAFRSALGRFPTGVVVVTAKGSDGAQVGMTVSSFNAVSLNPPLVLFSIDRGAPSLPVLSTSRAYGISILGKDQAELSARFAGARGDKWDGDHLKTGLTGCPLIKSSLAIFECTPFAAYDGGDHIIFVGRVSRFEIGTQEEPLVFFGGKYAAITKLSLS